MISVDPVHHPLVVDSEQASDATEVHAFQIEAHRFALCFFRVAERLWLRRIDALALFALIALAAGVRITGFRLCFC